MARVLIIAALLALALVATAKPADKLALLQTEANQAKEMLQIFNGVEGGKQFAAAIGKIIDWVVEFDPKVHAKKMLDPDATRTICEVVIDKGFLCEEHKIKTSDGFFLETFRVRAQNYTNGPVVLLSHGLMDSAGSWILYPPNTPGHSLSYQLASRGYDVWLGSVRCMRYGETHEVYGRYDPELWNNSFDEMGNFDVPETIAYALSVSGKSKLAVVGHSQGVTQMFAAVAQQPSMADKMSVFIALAPAGYFNYITNTLILFAAEAYLGEIVHAIGMQKFIQLPEEILLALPYLCEAQPDLIYYVLSSLFGDNPGAWVEEKYGVICWHSLGMTSVQNLIHWAQLVRNKIFQMQDFYALNPRHYDGAPTPPLYDISKQWPRSVPIAIIHGGADDLAPLNDVYDIIADLPAEAIVLQKLIPAYAHCDFHWGWEAPTLVYADSINLIAQYTNGTGW